MASSAHKCEVFVVDKVYEHPNAHSLEIIRPWGYQCIVQKGLHKPGDLRVYIPPDNVVPDTPKFEFLKGKLCIKAVRLRGEVSMGLIMPAPDGAVEGDDVTEAIGVVPYEPPVRGMPGIKMGPKEVAPPPAGVYVPKYDIEPLRRYNTLFKEREIVEITEKIHGSNICLLFYDGILHVRSRNYWLKYIENNLYWKSVRNSEWAAQWALSNPGMALFGEVIPSQSGFQYDLAFPEIRVFDIYDTRSCRFLDVEKCNRIRTSEASELKWVPIVRDFTEYNFDDIESLSNGPSLMDGASHIREGVVVKPWTERTEEIGRMILKMHGSDFLSN